MSVVHSDVSMVRQTRPLSASKKTTARPTVEAGEAVIGRRARKLQKTADHIGATAWALFETHGFGEVTMEAIAAAADVAKGTLYKHFPLKEALIRHRFEKDRLTYRNEIAAAVLAEPTCTARLAQFFRIEAAYLDPMRPYLDAYIRYLLRSGITEQDAGEREAENFIAALLRQGQSDGEISAVLPADVMAAHLIFMRSCTLLRWLNRDEGPLTARLEDMLQLFFHGALKNGRT